MVLQFLIAEYPQEFPLERLATSLSVELPSLRLLLEEGEASRLPDTLIRKMGEDLARLTGISLHWFLSGYLGNEQADLVPPEVFTTYVQLMKKAARAGVKPDVLEMAIDLLIMKHREVVVSGSPAARLQRL